jgi:NAD(P)H-flavin reductase
MPFHEVTRRLRKEHEGDWLAGRGAAKSPRTRRMPFHEVTRRLRKEHEGDSVSGNGPQGRRWGLFGVGSFWGRPYGPYGFWGILVAWGLGV